MLALVKVDPKRGFNLVQKPEPKIRGKDEILVEVGACGICGSDVKSYVSDEGALSRISQRGWPYPLGHEIGGTVREVGKEVTEFKEGDRVTIETHPPCGFCFYCRRGQTNLCANADRKDLGHIIVGGFAKYVLVTPRYLFKLPEAVSVEEAAVVEPLGVALRAVERTHLKPGDSAVVIGPGALGIMAAMLLKSAGIRTLVVAGRKTSRERLKIAAEIGATTVEVSGDNLQEETRALTGGLGVDVVFDFTGSSEALGEAIKLVKGGGEIVTVGGGTGSEFDMDQLVNKELTFLAVRHLQSSTWHRAINLVASRAIDLGKVITHTLPLEEYEKAFHLLLERRALKVVLTP
ncbi:zinc-binding dehydrogenase [Chloroflexota bacterium]